MASGKKGPRVSVAEKFAVAFAAASDAGEGTPRVNPLWTNTFKTTAERKKWTTSLRECAVKAVDKICGRLRNGTRKTEPPKYLEVRN